MKKLGINSYALEGNLVWVLVAKGLYSIRKCDACGEHFAYNNHKRERRTCSKFCSSELHGRKVKTYADRIGQNIKPLLEVSQGT